MGALFLQEKDVMAVLDFDMAIDAVEEGFRQYGLGLVQSPPWRDVCFAGKDVPHGAGPGIVQAMAYLEREKVAVIKHFYSFPESHTSMLRLIDAEAGKTLAVMEANYESWMRTGAAGAVGAKYLARESSSVAGIVGTGNQARAQIRFLARVRPVKELYAYSVDPLAKREEFAQEIESELKIDVVLVASAQEAVEKADVLVTATRSTEPIVEGAWVKRGLHITSMGADDPQKVELAPSVFSEVNKLVIDYEKALETAQLRIPLETGALKPDDIYASIGEVVAGKKSGRESETEVTIFHSTGMTVQDISLALAIYKKAREKGIGSELCTALRMLEGAL
jgi:alanine dehydrogenase